SGHRQGNALQGHAVAAGPFGAERVLSRDDGLQHPAPERRARRQARFPRQSLASQVEANSAADQEPTVTEPHANASRAHVAHFNAVADTWEEDPGRTDIAR